MYIPHAIFPILITEHFYQEHEEFKKLFLETGIKHFNNSGISDESTGSVIIHHEPEYENLFRFLNECIVQHINHLGFESNLYDINFTKSWLNVLRENSTPVHAHYDAHFSIVYYVNTPENFNQNISFIVKRQPNDPYEGAILVSNKSKIWNLFNSYSYNFFVKEGMALVFPSHLLHETLGNGYNINRTNSKEELVEKRICIASDVLLSFKDRAAESLGIQPVKNWRNFG
jgi:hypothetical protein